MSARLLAPLAALAASLGLIGVYLAFGGAGYEPASVADPCETRSVALLQERDLFETLALSSLDGAACQLGVGREELALALTDQAATEKFAEEHQISTEDVDAAVRAGLERSVDDAAAAGKVDGIEEAILRQVAANAPVGPAISALQALPGDNSIQGLLQELGKLQGVNPSDLGNLIPGIQDIPGYDQLQGLLP